MATEGICPGCGRPLPADGLKGLCPECLMKAGFGTGVAPGPDDPTERAAFTPPSLAEVAKLFPQLEVVALLGQGGMGAVYKARQPALDRWVALKVLPPQTAVKADFSERFNREARALARLNHPHIVAVHEFGQAGGLPYFIMEYVDGVTLRQLVQAKKLAPEQALAVVPQICEALQFAHDEGVVHRDIKPENILLDKKGRVKIADFGIAKIVEGEKAGQQTITGDRQIIGTPHYMAPEQVERPHLVDHRADIYSLGVVFYEMLTGELPLGKFAPPSSKVQVDVRLDEVVLHALEKEPQRRYQQASELKTDVEAIATEPNFSSRNLRRRRPAAVVPLIALLLVAVPLVSMLVYLALRPAPELGPVSRASVIRAEDTLRRAILDRLAEGGWKPESLSVSVSPDLRRAECRFGKVWKNGLTQEPFNAGIRLVPQGGGLWLVEGTDEFHALRFSVDASPGSGAVATAPGTAPTLSEEGSESRRVTYNTTTVSKGPLTMQIREAGKLTPRTDDPTQWQVDADLPESSVVHVKVGQEVECQADAFPGRVFKGKLTRVADSTKPGWEPAIYSAVVEVIKPELEFRRGMSVRLSFILAHRPDALRIPVQALSFRLSGNATVTTDLPIGLSPNELAMPNADERAARTVWVLRTNSEPEPVQIRIGITDNAFTEVTSGLREGERVVIGKTTSNPETQSDRPAALAPPKKTSTAGFDPVIERVLKAKDECFLDLDTAQTHGPAIIGGDTDLPAGMDLSIPFTPAGAGYRADRVVALDHMQVQPATSEDWDLSPNELSERLNSMGPQALGALRAQKLANQASKLPRTFLFRTSPWSSGVLQIVAFTESGVKLRYRFLPPEVARRVPAREKHQDTFGPPRQLIATWPDGVKIELTGLSQYPSQGAKSWRADGYELSAPPFDQSNADTRSFQPPGTRAVELMFSIVGLKSGPGSEAKLDLSNAFWTGKKFRKGVWQPDVKAIGVHVPTNAMVIHATLVMNAAEELRMICSLRTNVWLTDAASLLPAPLVEGERAVAFMYVSLRASYGTFPQVRLLDQTTMHNLRGMVTKIYPLKSGEAARLLGNTKSMIGAAGEAVGDERTDSIIVSAPPSVHEGVAQFLQESGALEQSAPRSRRTMQDETAGFGPAIERFLDFDPRKPTAYLDLDTGKYLDPAYKLPFGMDSTPEGVDLRASICESNTHARLAIGMALKAVATNRWEATPAEVRKELRVTRSEPEVRLVAGEVPQLFFFRTSDIGQGILQIRLGPVVDGGHQFHIRYKLLSPNESER